MIESSTAYQEAIVADERLVRIRSTVDIVDPDIVYGKVTASSESRFSKSTQLHDKNMENPVKYGTLENNRWRLNGSVVIYPQNPEEIVGQVGFQSEAISDANGVLNVWVEMPLSDVSILQACSVYFPNNDYDGIPVAFIVEVKQGGTAYFSKTFTDNAESSVSMDGFTVYNPDAIRVTVTKMNKEGRRLRIVEIVPGSYEQWDGNVIQSFAIKHQGDISCMSLPYGTCSIRINNISRRFEPRSKNGLFQSLEERQGVDISLSVRLQDKTDEYKRVGIFYQYSGGWKTGDNGLTMQWDLVDIVGLLSGRTFIPPSSLPSTLEGWVKSIVSQLGVNFSNRYTVDPNYASLSVSVKTSEDVKEISCGDLLRYVCMATATWPRADAESGKLAVEPFWNQGSKITLDNLVNYPVIKANEDIAAIIFELNDTAKTKYVVSGNATASSETKSVKNPFIKTPAQALTAARLILSSYGGNCFDILGRGDMASEIGDVDTVWLNESSATTARRIQQELSFSENVLKDCSSTLLQADGSFLFQERVVLTASGTWTAPAGVTQLRMILVGRGANGTRGKDGTWDKAGDDGIDGHGGKVWAQTIFINPQQIFSVSIGQDSVFGQYSSAQGDVFPFGYTDIASGDSFARTGVKNPVEGSGDGGLRGRGGVQGREHEEQNADGSYSYIVDNYPGSGKPGVPGVLGCVVIYWEKVNP